MAIFFLNQIFTRTQQYSYSAELDLSYGGPVANSMDVCALVKRKFLIILGPLGPA